MELNRRQLISAGLGVGLLGVVNTCSAGERKMQNSTCIVAIRNEKGVIMAGDSCGGSGSYAQVFKTQKVAKVGEYLVGYTTSFRMGQILHHTLSVTKYNKEDDILNHLINTFVPALRKAFKDNGWLTTKDGVESGGNFILAHGNRIFEINSDFSVLEPESEYFSVGCGEDLAMGAMYALSKDKTKTDKEKIQIALEAATKFSAYVRPPYIFVQNYEEEPK